MSFVFQPKKEAPNWPAIEKCDLKTIIKSNDIGKLEANLGNLVNAKLSLEDIKKIGCPNLIKLFKVGQLSLEYLLFTQQYSEATLQNA